MPMICDWPERLGEPRARYGQWPDMSYRRQFQHGTVIVTKDGGAGRVE
jgi:hypothetical protein